MGHGARGRVFCVVLSRVGKTKDLAKFRAGAFFQIDKYFFWECDTVIVYILTRGGRPILALSEGRAVALLSLSESVILAHLNLLSARQGGRTANYDAFDGLHLGEDSERECSHGSN